MNLLKSLPTGAFLASAILAGFNTTDAWAVQAGSLRCNVGAGVGLLVTGSRNLSCVFKRLNGVRERYDGTIRTFGVDIGVSGAGVILWTVIAANPRNLPGYALAGTYDGATASATVGVGVGGNVLVGGGNGISLQPVSISAQTGLSVSGGIGSVTLTPAR
jgi:hypothetical protein